jgi:hypothetical protein
MSSERITGGCHCGDVRYLISARPQRHSLCHCKDCRRSAGAHMVGWAVVETDALRVTGATASYNSSRDVLREFCPRCGTGLFYRETLFPEKVEIQSGTFDDPEIFPPTAAIQMADAPSWIVTIGKLPQHRRLPGPK